VGINRIKRLGCRLGNAFSSLVAISCSLKLSLDSHEIPEFMKKCVQAIEFTAFHIFGVFRGEIFRLRYSNFSRVAESLHYLLYNT
jgi:hypothetical protein